MRKARNRDLWLSIVPRCSCETEPWWSDALLADARIFTSEFPARTVVVGDFNQSRAYDHAAVWFTIPARPARVRRVHPQDETMRP